MSLGFLLSLLTAIPCVVFIGVVLSGLLVPRSQRDQILRDRDEWRQSSYSFKQQLAAMHERNGFVSGALTPTRTPVGCQHPEYIDVTTPVYPGEVVARLCTNPACYAQLPADFEPPKERPTYRVKHSGRGILEGPDEVFS